MISNLIKQQVEARFGQQIRYPKDCEALAAHISTSCKKQVSPSTLKRLFGFVKGIQDPRLFTLDIIANYLKCDCWDNLIKKITNTENSEFKGLTELSLSKLKSGNIVQFTYKPDRIISIKYIRDNSFEIVSSENSKLQVGDIISVNHFVQDHPLIITQVIRDKKKMGQYIAGKVSGITSIRKL